MRTIPRRHLAVLVAVVLTAEIGGIVLKNCTISLQLVSYDADQIFSRTTYFGWPAIYRTDTINTYEHLEFVSLEETQIRRERTFRSQLDSRSLLLNVGFAVSALGLSAIVVVTLVTRRYSLRMLLVAILLIAFLCVLYSAACSRHPLAEYL